MKKTVFTFLMSAMFFMVGCDGISFDDDDSLDEIADKFIQKIETDAPREITILGKSARAFFSSSRAGSSEENQKFTRHLFGDLFDTMQQEPIKAAPIEAPSTERLLTAQPFETALNHARRKELATDCDLAWAAYKDRPGVPAGVRPLTEAELKKWLRGKKTSVYITEWLGISSSRQDAVSMIPVGKGITYDLQTGFFESRTAQNGLFLRGEGKSFGGALLLNENTGEIVLSFRGTDFKDWDDMKTNITQVRGDDTEQHHYADALLALLLEATRAEQKPILVTGHSKGGGMASYAMIANTLEPRVRGSVFNPAGLSGGVMARQSVKKIIAAEKAITNIYLQGDPVSAHGRLVGSVYEVKNHAFSVQQTDTNRNVLESSVDFVSTAKASHPISMLSRHLHLTLAKKSE